MTPSITPAELAALRGKIGRVVVQKAEGEILAVFVAGKLVNPLNASAWGWQKRSRLAKQWKLAVANALFIDAYRGQGIVGVNAGFLLMVMEYRAESDKPKRVTFAAHVFNKFDGDGLQAALKPVRDSLIQCGVIHSDAPDSGHVFIYEQVIDRARRGVEIRVSPRGAVRKGGAE